ncbi:DUF2442 domain-containing protein [Methyloprofundus sp.]|uniref:DUF2442 domain-containing protein n=1 Tax=Methyloprofundus sp. TaxID=2020875 RepID=UPI003D11F3C2
MSYPKVKLVKALDNYQLIVRFDNNQTKQYDVSPLLKKAMFSPLKNLALFKAVKVENGGYAVVWNEDIDISEYELWQHGQPIP